jgi:hypothetical protein
MFRILDLGHLQIASQCMNWTRSNTEPTETNLSQADVNLAETTRVCDSKGGNSTSRDHSQPAEANLQRGWIRPTGQGRDGIRCRKDAQGRIHWDGMDPIHLTGIEPTDKDPDPSQSSIPIIRRIQTSDHLHLAFLIK